MGAQGRGARVGLVGTIILAMLVLAGAPAAAQTPTTTAAPEVETVDVEDFEDRAQRWAEARRRAREKALRNAEASDTGGDHRRAVACPAAVRVEPELPGCEQERPVPRRLPVLDPYLGLGRRNALPGPGRG